MNLSEDKLVEHKMKKDPDFENAVIKKANTVTPTCSTKEDPRHKSKDSQPEPSPTCSDLSKASIEILPEQSNDNKNAELDTRPVRLFVGQVPETLFEPHISSLFNSKGITLLDVTVIRDKFTGRHRHCAFVTVSDRAGADKAIAEFHNKQYLEGMASPMQVREANQPKSKAAYAAMRAYSKMIGTSMPVFADNPADQTPKASTKAMYNYRMGLPYMPFNPFFPNYIQQMHTPYIYGYIPANMGAQMNGGYGYQHMNDGRSHEQFNDSQNKTNNFNTMKRSQNYLDNQSGVFPNTNSLSKMSTYTEESLGAQPQGGPYYFAHPQESYNPYMVQQNLTNYQKYTTYTEGPQGANLFVNNLPEEFNDDDLKELFSPYGTILSSKVFVDKYTQQSKGFGFVSFQTPLEAQTAIEDKNGYELDQGRQIAVELKRPRRLKVQDYF